jgi:hypothetical protein
MKTSVNLNFLRIPMSMLYDIAQPELFPGLSPAQIERLTQEYTPEELAGILQALDFAQQNPTYDFKALMNDLPHGNAQISEFLRRIRVSIPFS